MEWGNQVDLTYRGELRELSELNVVWTFLFWVGNVAASVAAAVVGFLPS